MSESREHKRRFYIRLQYVSDFEKWQDREPPMWRIFKWRKWKKERPVKPRFDEV